MNRDDRKIFIAENSGRLIGFVGFRIKAYAMPLPSRPLLWFLSRRRAPQNSLPLEPLSWVVIEEIFVEAPHRRRGTAKALINTSLAWFRQMGIRRVELGVLANNVDGLKFWQKSGFLTYRLLMYQNLDDVSRAHSTD